MLAFVAPPRLIITVSSASSSVSPVTDTVIVLLVSPGANVKVPGLNVVKSVPEVAVPLQYVYCTVTCLPLAALRLTVKFMFVEPVSPSVTLGELMDMIGGSSSSVIVPVPVPVPIVAPKPTPLNPTTTVSSGSSSVSPCTATVIVLLV